MDKQTKRDTAFCERDAVADMRLAEREVLRAYAVCASDGGSRRLRTLLAQNFAAACEDMAALDCAMRQAEKESGGASEEAIKRARNEFTRRASDLTEN